MTTPEFRELIIAAAKGLNYPDIHIPNPITKTESNTLIQLHNPNYTTTVSRISDEYHFNTKVGIGNIAAQKDNMAKLWVYINTLNQDHVHLKITIRACYKEAIINSIIHEERLDLENPQGMIASKLSQIILAVDSLRTFLKDIQDPPEDAKAKNQAKQEKSPRHRPAF